MLRHGPELVDPIAERVRVRSPQITSAGAEQLYTGDDLVLHRFAEPAEPLQKG